MKDLVLPEKPRDARVGDIIKLAVMAVGGQGGGVLTGWIEALARAQGYVCQATSVAGVAQRTGATIYYVEMAPVSDQQPVFALAPSAGDVDVLIASEMMEVGRAVLRGFVTPDRTTLIGSTHRALAVSEKSAPGDGIADADEVRAAAEIASQRLILANMDRLAVGQGSVISASLFGALAGSGALPFDRAAFEDAIRAGGKGVEPSLRAFAAGFDVAVAGGATPDADAPVPSPQIVGPTRHMKDWQALITRAEQLPEPVQAMAKAGLRKVVDFQDCRYGTVYLDFLATVVARDDAAQTWLLSLAAAKYIANAMAYDDIIRVADLKTRGPRFDRIRAEMGAKDGQLIHLTEFFHPRAEEIAGMLPAKMGAWMEASPNRMARLDRWFGKGRRLRTDALPAYLALHVLGGLKTYRLRTRRHEVETAHLKDWLQQSLAPLPKDYALSVELVKCRRLIKGYSDTHARGLTKFATVMGAVALLKGRKDAAEWIARLREAALQDPDGKALKGAIETVRSFV
ncbi:indolepyruvate oxidoreductase subunit beta family protein [Pseudorhodobacter sp.]|uniref:indolepyruvate oxidoreductase subunit beta family protein n=1 Tax=Pseudorhodobacter sp. TaxID=1934400 RepID=UPI0026476901|nr:indolepyruvate oxidoreductase subunit beta family protein [Pseudorhodobacter sp.]MDN5786083.1 indolepyruvate oxidoreductase subunit beta family protein [Pseudorhodobacter sp.]